LLVEKYAYKFKNDWPRYTILVINFLIEYKLKLESTLTY